MPLDLGQLSPRRRRSSGGRSGPSFTASTPERAPEQQRDPVSGLVCDSMAVYHAPSPVSRNPEHRKTDEFVPVIPVDYTWIST